MNKAVQKSEQRTGVVGAIAGVPGWVWIVIGAVVLLVIGLTAAATAATAAKAIPSKKDFDIA